MQPNDVKSCIDAISQLTGADESTRESWSDAGRALARDYLWPNVANEILGVYENAIKQKFHSGVR